jgi:hypothetical protein
VLCLDAKKSTVDQNNDFVCHKCAKPSGFPEGFKKRARLRA